MNSGIILGLTYEGGLRRGCSDWALSWLSDASFMYQ
jgi:hypothetical protein